MNPMLKWGALLLSLTAGTAFAAGGDLGQTVQQATNWTAISMFVLFVGMTLGITKWAAGQTKSTSDFYTGGGGISGFKNGLAIAGDFMSAASFLGISAMVFGKGYDGLMYSIGWLVGWPILLFLVAERLRNLGKFTFADVASFRLARTPVRTMAAINTLVVVAFYLIAQMVGAGQLIKLLFGLSYNTAVVIVGVLMMAYVLFGGMLATTWVQIIKAVMLLGGATFMAFMVLYHFSFSFDRMFGEAVRVFGEVNKTDGLKIMGPGTLFKSPVDAISLGLALMFGTAGLPHILMRFFTVNSAKEARKSVFVATGFIGYFYLLTFIIGFGAILFVAQNPQYLDAAKMAATGKLELRGGGNMAAVHLSHALGGDLFLGFISAVAFATILAVVAGLTLSGASAVSHDLYASVFNKGCSSEQELRVSKMATVALGILAIVLGIAFEKENVAYMVMLAFTIACSSNFPVLFMSVLWKNCTTRGAVVGGFVGLVLAAVLTIGSASVWEAVMHNPKGSAWFPYNSAALFSMSAAFFTIWLVSILDNSEQAKKERALYPSQQLRSETGLGASSAAAH